MQLETYWKATMHQQINEQTQQEMHFLTNLMKLGKWDYKNTELHYYISPNATASYYLNAMFLRACFFLSFILPEAKLLYPGVTYECDCRVTPSVSGRREQGESSICRNNYLRSLILRLNVHRCICSQDNSASRYFAWDNILHVYACEHTGLTGKEMKMWVALTSSDSLRAKELHKDHQDRKSVV